MTKGINDRYAIYYVPAYYSSMADIHLTGYWTFNAADGSSTTFETRDEAIKAADLLKSKQTTTSKSNTIKRKIIMVKNVNQDVLLLYSTDTDCYYFRNSKATFISLQTYRTQDIALVDFEAKKVMWIKETENETE
jgi:hypothetical protein